MPTVNGAAFDRFLEGRFRDFADGLSQTILIADAEEAVPWAKPEELEYDPNKPVPKLRVNEDGRFTVAMGDGSVRTIRGSVGDRELRLLITKDDGQPIPRDVFDD